MRYVVALNYPRSGWHLMVECLSAIVPGFKSCSFYDHCNVIPCTDRSATLQLYHDHDLKFPVDVHRLYLMQVRHPLLSIASWMEMHNPVERDAPVIWKGFLPEKLEFWRQHVHKWALNPAIRDKYVLTYEDFMERPVESIAGFLMFAGYMVDRMTVEHVVQEKNIKPRRTVMGMKYLSPDDAVLVKEIAGEEMKVLGISDERSGVVWA